MPRAGPELPPHLSAKRKHEEQPAKEEASAIQRAPASPDAGEKKRQRVIGPSLPPAALDERPAAGPSSPSTSSSDDDEDIGPALPPAPHETAAYETTPPRTTHDAAPEPAKLQREEWMTLPPTSSDWSARLDPTKLRSRKFQSGKSAAAPKPAGGGIGAVWTETPVQKAQRLADEVMGVAAPAALADGGGRGKVGRGDDRETARRIAEYNEARRGKSLVEEHKGRGVREEEDDPSARAFDREKDVVGPSKISHKKKREMLARAGELGSRFAAGSYL